MALYMKIDGIDGNATAPGYEKWIPILSFGFGMGRRIVNAVPGKTKDREGTILSLSEVTVSKTVDVATTALVRAVLENTAKSVKIVLAKSLDEVSAGKNYSVEYVLKEVLVSGYSVQTGSGGPPVENIVFNFGALNITYTPYEKDQKPGSPLHVGYDLATAKII